MNAAEELVALLCAIIAVVLVGRRLKVPYPIALVVGGLCISLVPGLPEIRIEPDKVFLLFLPPLLYAAAWFTSWHEFKANLRPILLLAVGLVVFTTVVVGLVVHALIPGIPLAVAFALGAIVSPPDAVATTAIAQQVKLPKRIVTVLEGESLVNDATGLVALRFALAAAASGKFSLGQATLEFVWVAVGGMAIGLAVGFVTAKVMRCIKDDSLLIMVSLLVPYAAYLPAERLHVSGVLAAVGAGIYGGWRGPELIGATTRLSAVPVWSLLVFLLNCTLFILIGLQLPHVLSGPDHLPWWKLGLYGVVVSAVVIVVRPLWVFPATWIPRWLSKSLRQRDPIPPWQAIAIISWSGMRGVVSLAAALALPETFADGRPFPGRDLIVFLSFCVILSTLVLQGLTLPFLVRRLGVKEKRDEHHEREVRLKVLHAALEHLNKLGTQPGQHEAAVQRVIKIYGQRVQHQNDELANTLGWSTDRERWVHTRRLLLEALTAERRELVKLHHENHVDDELRRRIEREMDLEETRLKTET
jgi:Na+/H+ antiporter